MDIYSRLDALPDSVRRHILDAIVGAPRPSPTSSEPPATSALSAATCAAARHGGPQPPKPPAAPAAVPGLKLVGGACVVDGFLSPDLVEDARQAAREALAERHRQAAIGGGLQLPGEGRAVDTQSRGDHMMWLHPQSADAAAGPGAAAARPPLQAVVAALEGVRRQLLLQGYDVGGSTTHQLAVYPGGGARYVRHADASLSCPTRAVTAIVYLNEQDWDPQVDGGCLALYNVPHATCMAHTTPPAAGPAAAPVQAAHAAPAADGAAGTGAAAAGAVPAALVPAEAAAAAAAAETPDAATAAGAAAGATREPGRGAVARRGAAGTGLQCGEPAVLVAPLGGRLLVFESHLWHEVMPAHRHRYAITAWFHRTPPQQPPPPAASPQPPAPAPQAPQPTQLPQPPQPPAVPQVAVDATTAAPGTSTSTAPAAAPSPDCTSTSAAAAGADAAASPGPLGSLAAGQAPMPAEAASDRGGGMACVGRRPGRRRPRIFVSIAAYRDPECAWTLHSLFAAAAHPERVRVGVVWQVHPVEDVGLVRVAGAKSHPEWLQRVRQVVVPAAEATGPCKARALAQSLWDGEEYVLQLDSHMRMVPGWDELCIQQLAEAEALAERGKAVLSTYPLGYSGDGAAASCPDPATAPATLLCARGFEADGFLRTAGRVLRQRPAAPVRCGFWAAGLSFARSAWLQEVPYCPALPHLFFGEEAYMAARGWTRGWDVYAPALPLAFHQWQRSSRQHTYQRDVRVAAAAGGEKEVGEKEAGEKGEGGEEGGEERAEAAAALRRRSQARVLAVLRTGGGGGSDGEADGGDRGSGAAFALLGREQELQSGRRGEQEDQEGQGQEEGWPVGHVWGLGRERSLAELAAAFGVDYVRGEVVRPELASWGGLGPEAFVGGSSQ